MPYLLDTNHCSYLMNGLNKQPDRRKLEETNTIKVFESITAETLYMSEVSLGELFYGAEVSAIAFQINISRISASFLSNTRKTKR